MMLLAFNDNDLKSQLVKLKNWQCCVFGAACCERLLPNYLAFQKDTGSGEFDSLKNALHLIWSFWEGEKLNPDEIRKNNAVCELIAPHSDDFESLFVTSAQDACFAVCSLFDYLLEEDIDKIVQVARYATDSVDLYVQEIENMKSDDSDLEHKILVHPLMQRELRKQKEDLETIEKTFMLSADFVRKLKKSWKNNGRSNLDVPA